MAPPVNISEIKLTDIDFPAVEEATNAKVVLKYLQLLEEDGIMYKELYQACKDKLKALNPKLYAIQYPRATTAEEEAAANNDLFNWENEVKRTDEMLRQAGKAQGKSGGALPAPRGSDGTDVVARENVANDKYDEGPNKTNEGYARDTTKMKDYYRNWDQVDVDKMEQDMEAKEEAEREKNRARQAALQQTQDFEQDKEIRQIRNMSEVQRQQLATSEKEKGNESFYANDLEEADMYYSRSLRYQSDAPAVLTNRALVRLKLLRPKDARSDCDAALELQPRYMKALHRRGKANYDIGDFESAVADFQSALKIDPQNAQINGDLREARKMLLPGSSGAANKSSSAASSTTSNSRDQKKKMPITESAQPGQFRRVQITEGSSSEDESDEDDEIKIENVDEDPEPVKVADEKVMKSSPAKSKSSSTSTKAAAVSQAPQKMKPLLSPDEHFANADAECKGGNFKKAQRELDWYVSRLEATTGKKISSLSKSDKFFEVEKKVRKGLQSAWDEQGGKSSSKAGGCFRSCGSVLPSSEIFRALSSASSSSASTSSSSSSTSSTDSTSTSAPKKFQRMQIVEESDSDEDSDDEAKKKDENIKPKTSSTAKPEAEPAKPAPGFQRMQITEDSSSEESEDETEEKKVKPAGAAPAAPATATAATTSAPAFQRMQIAEVSDSEDEEDEEPNNQEAMSPPSTEEEYSTTTSESIVIVDPAEVQSSDGGAENLGEQEEEPQYVKVNDEMYRKLPVMSCSTAASTSAEAAEAAAAPSVSLGKQGTATGRDEDPYPDFKVVPTAKGVETGKTIGNALFKQGEFEEARKVFEKCVFTMTKGNKDETLSPESAVQASMLLSNAAFTALKMKDYSYANKVATDALLFDDTNTKARYRRAQARYELGEFSAGLEDCEVAMRCCAEAAGLQELLAKFREKVPEFEPVEPGFTRLEIQADSDSDSDSETRKVETGKQEKPAAAANKSEEPAKFAPPQRTTASSPADTHLEEFEKLKASGNKAFSEGKLQDAVEKYQTCISFATTKKIESSKIAVLYTNRAIANYKLEKYEECERDAAQSLELNNAASSTGATPSDPKVREAVKKAVFKRSQSRLKLGRELSDALRDINRVLEYPGNKNDFIDDAEKLKREILNKMVEKKREQEAEKLASKAAVSSSSINTGGAASSTAGPATSPATATGAAASSPLTPGGTAVSQQVKKHSFKTPVNAYDFQRTMMSLRNYPIAHVRHYLVNFVPAKIVPGIFKKSSIETDHLSLVVKALVTKNCAEEGTTGLAAASSEESEFVDYDFLFALGKTHMAYLQFTMLSDEELKWVSQILDKVPADRSAEVEGFKKMAKM